MYIWNAIQSKHVSKWPFCHLQRRWRTKCPCFQEIPNSNSFCTSSSKFSSTVLICRTYLPCSDVLSGSNGLTPSFRSLQDAWDAEWDHLAWSDEAQRLARVSSVEPPEFVTICPRAGWEGSGLAAGTLLRRICSGNCYRYIRFLTLVLELWYLQKLLEFDPVKRITAKDALRHPYFDDLDKTQFATTM